MRACNKRGLRPHRRDEAGEGFLSSREVVRWGVAVLLLAAVAPGAKGAYVVTDLGVLPSGTSSNGVAINTAGQITGNANTGNSSAHAYVTTVGAGQLTDLGTLGGTTSFGVAINNHGVIVGESAVSGSQTVAMSVTAPGTMQAFQLLTGWTNSFATGINDSGQVAGYATIAGGVDRAFFGTVGGTPTQMGTLGGANSLAFGINGQGVVVGYSDTSSGGTHAFTAINGVMTDLGGLGASNTSFGMAINDSGLVVGYGGIAGAYHAFVATGPNSLVDLSTLTGSGQSFAYGVDSAGDIVGTSSAVGGGSHAFIVLAHTTQMLDLNLLLQNGAGWVLSQADGINNQGQIVGTGTLNGQVHAFVLTPVPEPSAWITTSVGLATLGIVSLRRTLKHGRIAVLADDAPGDGPRAR
jgi:probable HAF family extracellular repeat protein